MKHPIWRSSMRAFLLRAGVLSRCRCSMHDAAVAQAARRHDDADHRHNLGVLPNFSPAVGVKDYELSPYLTLFRFRGDFTVCSGSPTRGHGRTQRRKLSAARARALSGSSLRFVRQVCPRTRAVDAIPRH